METKAHTVKRFDAELEELNNNVVKMASAVEEQLGRLGDALVNLNADEAAKVMAEDHVINSWEAELDDYLETIISRRQPQAVDLRLLLGYYRMTTDFERMGDEIRNAAKGVRKLSELVKPLSEPALANVSTLFSLHALLRVMGDDMIACVRLLDPERARALVARRTIVSAEVDEALSDTVERLKTGELKLAAERPDLILLDRMLPDRPGEEWLRELRSDAKTADVPVIILTARGNESDRVAGLDAGADDYVVKPFLPRELTARVRAVLRRRGAAVIAGRLSPMPSEETASTADEERVIVCGPLKLNEARFEATAAGKPLKLSAKEFKLLSLFAAKPGRVFSRANLLDAVWQSAFVDERTVDVHMLRLRKALAGSAAEDMIETVRGVGYRFRDPQTALNTPASE